MTSDVDYDVTIKIRRPSMMAADGFHVQDVTVVIPAGEFFRYDLPKEVIPAIGYNQKGRLITMRIVIKYIVMFLV